MNHAYIVDALRTPFGRYGGALGTVRADDPGAIPIRTPFDIPKAETACRLP